MYKALSVLFSGPDRLDKVWISELHLLGTQLFSLLMHLRRQITWDSISTSKNVDVFFCRIWQIIQVTMLITFAGLQAVNLLLTLLERVKFLIMTVLLIAVKLKLFQLAMHLTIYNAGIYFWLQSLTFLIRTIAFKEQDYSPTIHFG